MTTNDEISRVTRSKEQARLSYNKLSHWYDVLAGSFEKKPRELALQKLNVAEGERVLEVGFGTGHCIVALARSVGGSGSVAGIDISEGMLDVTSQRVREAGLTDRVELRRGDATHLPFESDSFDAIFTSFTLELFDTPDIPVVVAECKRVLRQGGRICVASMSKEGEAGVLLKLYEWAHRILPSYVDCRPIFVRKALEEGGFKVADVTMVSMWGLLGEIVVAKKV
jgi:ubiquinone/menaquinone biosynthesis C-methylase UbiE